MTTDYITFEAEIKQNGTMNAAFVDFPFSTEELFGKKGQVKIKALLDEKVEYRGSLAKMKSDGHLLGLTQEVRKQLGKTFGDKVTVKLWEDQEERIVEIPEDVLEVFEKQWQKTINLDVRFLLWVMDKYHGAGYLLNEMTIRK